MTESGLIEASPHECWIAGRAETGESSFAVRHPYDGTEIATVWEPGRAQVDRALAAACARTEPEPEARVAALHRLADALAARAGEAAELVTAERGTPITAAGSEVSRSVAALLAAAREPEGHGRVVRSRVPAWVRRRSRGPVLATTGNAHPVEYAARAAAAALAAGSPLVLVPSPDAPLSALLLGEVLADAGLPGGWFSILPVRGRLPVEPPGEFVRVEYGTEPDSTVVLCSDWSGEPDLDLAAHRIAAACDRPTTPPGTATTRVIVAESCFERLLPPLRSACAARAVGSPHDPSVAIGPPHDEQVAAVVAQRIDAALDAGYRMVAGGGHDGASMEPTVLAASGPGLGPWREDIPGPVVLLAPVPGLDEAVAAANDLGRERAVALLTRDIGVTRTASSLLTAGVVTVGAGQPPPWDTGAAVRELTRETTTVFPGDGPTTPLRRSGA